MYMGWWGEHKMTWIRDQGIHLQGSDGSWRSGEWAGIVGCRKRTFPVRVQSSRSESMVCSRALKMELSVYHEVRAKVGVRPQWWSGVRSLGPNLRTLYSECSILMLAQRQEEGAIEFARSDNNSTGLALPEDRYKCRSGKGSNSCGRWTTRPSDTWARDRRVSGEWRPWPIPHPIREFLGDPPE